MIIIIVLLNIIFSFGGVGRVKQRQLKEIAFFLFSHFYLGHVTIEVHCWVICVKVGENQPELKPHNL